jgi:hypothetical protein
VLESLNTWVESMRFAHEVQRVISMRLILLAQGGPQATVEAHRMIAEKLDAFADAEAAIAKALAHGEELMVAAKHAYAPVRRCVRANNRRLLRALGSEMKVAAN